MTLQNYNEWVKKNWFTLLGILIILLVVWYDTATNMATTKAKVDECIKFYEAQLELCHCIGKQFNYEPRVIGNLTVLMNE